MGHREFSTLVKIVLSVSIFCGLAAAIPSYYSNSNPQKVAYHAANNDQNQNWNWGSQPQRGNSVCTLPADIGPCRAAFPRYFYNSAAGQCQLFNWGGCHGNENRFVSINECQTSCGGANG